MKHVFLMGARRRQNQAACNSSLAVLQPGAEILLGVANKGAHKVYNTLPMMQLELYHHRRMTFVTKTKSLPLTQEERLVTATGQVQSVPLVDSVVYQVDRVDSGADLVNFTPGGLL